MRVQEFAVHFVSAETNGGPIALHFPTGNCVKKVEKRQVKVKVEE
jgi:hypothetical protein